MSQMLLQEYNKKHLMFVVFLAERGAEILQPTNEWELLRFRTVSGVSILYRNKHGSLRPVGQMQEAWDAFKHQKTWRSMPATPRKKLSSEVQSLIKRDGNRCFYCLQEMFDDDMSVEHLVSITHGGPNHMANFVLAHRKCNNEAGTLSAMEKIRLHVESFLAVQLGTAKPIMP